MSNNPYYSASPVDPVASDGGIGRCILRDKCVGTWIQGTFKESDGFDITATGLRIQGNVASANLGNGFEKGHEPGLGIAGSARRAGVRQAAQGRSPSSDARMPANGILDTHGYFHGCEEDHPVALQAGPSGALVDQGRFRNGKESISSTRPEKRPKNRS